MDDELLGCVCVAWISLTLCIQVGHGPGLGFPCPGRGIDAKLRFLTKLSMDAGTTHGVIPLPPIQSPYHTLWSIFCTPWLPNFVLAKILLNVNFIFRKISQVSKLGARASRLNYQLLGCHFLPPTFYFIIIIWQLLYSIPLFGLITPLSTFPRQWIPWQIYPDVGCNI